jgi:hypothetical protein
MESAKRASEIHKKRTGRAYRITEETVINEQMYEEEDDAPRYRLAANLHLPNTLLQQRAQALMSIQMENRRLLGEAVNSTLQHNAQFGNQAQFVSPGMMSMPQSFQYTMPSPHIFHQSPQIPTFGQSPQTPMGYTQSPYPSSPDDMRHSYHQRSTSIAEVPQYRPSAHNSPIETHDRRMSIPPPSVHAPSNNTQDRVDSAVSSSGSSPTTPMARQQLDNSTYDPTYQSMGNMLGPLTTELPRETRQLLASGMWPSLDESTFDRMMQNPSDPSYQQPLLYNYRPNSSKGGNEPSAADGLSQTLSSTPPDSSLNATSNKQTYNYGYDASSSAFNFDNMDSFNAFSGGANSAQPTPAANDEWTSFLDNDMFGEGLYGTPV